MSFSIELIITMAAHNIKLFLASILILFTVHSYSISSPAYASDAGSFHISQFSKGSWNELYKESFSVEYQTKTFAVTPEHGQVKIRIVQKKVSYGDTDLIQLQACDTILTPSYARYADTHISVLEDILYDDHNVAVNHEKPIELLWNLPSLCTKVATLTIRANEYESPEKNAFWFPEAHKSFQTYTFKQNGSLTMDGLLSEVDGKITPDYSPFWTAGTGHPSNNTHIYMKDDKRYVYVAADITLDNSNEFGPDWFKIIAQNTKSGKPKEYRVDDYHETYGKCGFGITSKVTYRHQTCEARIPKNELRGDRLDFVMRYYGTGGGPNPSFTVINPVSPDPTTDTTPSLTGTIAVVGGDIIQNIQYQLYRWNGSSWVLSIDWSNCTPDDGLLDENTEDFTCTTSTLTTAGLYKFVIYGDTDAGGSRQNNDADQFTLNIDTTAPDISLSAIGTTSSTTPTLSGTATDASGTVSGVEFQMDGTGGSWSSCTASDGAFNGASEAFTCTSPTLSTGEHTVYVRATDSNTNTTTGGSEATDTFTIITPSSTPSPVPTSAPSTSSTSNSSEHSVPQIPQLSGGDNGGGVHNPIEDSYTAGQTVSTTIEPQTFNYNAFVSSKAVLASYESGVLPNPLTGLFDDSKRKTNIIHAGSLLGVRYGGVVNWQIGNIQQIWYKSYAPIGSDKDAAIIIPELQKKPSIVALSYLDQDLIPPGKTKYRFSSKNLKLAYSIDGVSWKILPSSTVDAKSHTVAAIHKIGGYYMIVSR